MPALGPAETREGAEKRDTEIAILAAAARRIAALSCALETEKLRLLSYADPEKQSSQDKAIMIGQNYTNVGRDVAHKREKHESSPALRAAFYAVDRALAAGTVEIVDEGGDE